MLPALDRRPSPLDPRTHLLFALALLLPLFRWERPAALAVLAAAGVAYGLLHHLPGRPFLAILRFLRALLLITVTLNLVLTPGHVLIGVAPLHLWITREGVHLALLTAVRLIGAVWIAHALYRAVEPEALVAGLARLAGRLAAPGHRLHHAVVVASLALGFLPWFAAHLHTWREGPLDLDGRLRRLITAGEAEIAARATAAEAGTLTDPTTAAAALRLTAADGLFAVAVAAVVATGWLLQKGAL